MSNRAHSGRCFRAWRRTTRRKLTQGKPWEYPIRQKVPAELRAFLGGQRGQRRAGPDAMNLAIQQYAIHQIRTASAAPPRIGARGR